MLRILFCVGTKTSYANERIHTAHSEDLNNGFKHMNSWLEYESFGKVGGKADEINTSNPPEQIPVALS